MKDRKKSLPNWKIWDCDFVRSIDITEDGCGFDIIKDYRTTKTIKPYAFE